MSELKPSEKLNGTFLIIGSGECYNTRVVQNGNGIFDAIIELMFGQLEHCDDPNYWRKFLNNEDNWTTDNDLGRVHCRFDVGETDRIYIYRIENPEPNWRERAERDKALALVASYDRQDELIGTEFEGVDEVTDVIRLLKDERDQYKALAKSLSQFVEHKDGCRQRTPWIGPPQNCTCGLSDLLEKARAL